MGVLPVCVSVCHDVAFRGPKRGWSIDGWEHSSELDSSERTASVSNCGPVSLVQKSSFDSELDITRAAATIHLPFVC